MFLDVAIGIFVAFGLADLFGTPPSFLFVLYCVVVALLPDSDVIVFLTQSRFDHHAHEHRTIFHRPLIVIGGGVALLLLLHAHALWVWGFIVLSIWHFIHDSFGLGWGVAWFSPFSRKLFKIFSDKKNQWSWQPLASWTPEELSLAVERYGERDWFSRYYLSLHPLGVAEFLIFCCAIAYMIWRF